MRNNQLDTPILFLVFNRLETTKLVFDTIKQVRPKQLFIAADGPRDGNQYDLLKCEEVRKYVTKNIDWPCELKTLFRESNLGCGKSVSAAITWFFESVPEGIIVEDDVLPSKSFFHYCEKLLAEYRDNSKVMSISGCNLLKNKLIGDQSYFFSEYTGIWGWASWARAWSGYDYQILSWKTQTMQNKFKNKYSNGQYLFFKMIFDSIENINTWDYQWWYHHLAHEGLAIIPSVNLTENIGFNNNATHTIDADQDIKNLKKSEMDFPLIHPKSVEVDLKYELALAKRFYWGKQSLLKKVFRKLMKIIKVS